jgi:hypothetical protein
MSSTEATATPSEKLTEALQEFLRSELSHASAVPNTGRKPTKRDVLFFVIFAANLALLTWSLPAETLKSEQLEFFEKIIPAVGGSLLALLAAWFKDNTLQVIQHPWFRWSQLPLGVLALLLGAPILPLHLKVEPADSKAILYLDKSDQDHFREWKDTPVWVRFAGHDFIAKHYDGNGWNERIFHWGRRDLAAMWWRGEIDLPLLYTVRMNLPDSGLIINIQKKTEFDEDFLRADMLAPQHLTKLDTRRIVFTPISSGDLSPLTKLPVGDYELMASKTGCESSVSVKLIVPSPANPEKCEVELKPVQCRP